MADLTTSFSFAIDSNEGIREDFTVTLDVEGRSIYGVVLTYGPAADWDNGKWQVWDNHSDKSDREQLRDFLRLHITGRFADRVAYMAARALSPWEVRAAA